MSLSATRPPPPPTTDGLPLVGEDFLGFRLVAVLGRGALGRVFLATEARLADRPVVLKLTPCDGQEHLSLARLAHPHIVPLLDAQDVPARNLRMLCMPYLGGVTLAEAVQALRRVPAARRHGRDLVAVLDSAPRLAPLPGADHGSVRRLLGRLSYAEAVCWLGARLADALEFAHQRRLVHLDVKPSNVLLAADGLPLLLDFHLARPPAPAGEPAAGHFGGSPGYMAPEVDEAVRARLEGRPVPVAVDGRADVYSLGKVLYHALADGDGLRRPRPLHRCNPQVSRGLSDVVARCLEADPRRRYARAADLAADLRRHLAAQPLQGVPNRSWRERWRKCWRRHPSALSRAGALLGLAVVLAVAVAAVWGVAGRHADARHQEARQALDDGRDLLARGRLAEAEHALERGLGLARALGEADLVRDLEAARARARAAAFRVELHALTDELRFRLDPEALAPEAARRLERACADAWERARGVEADGPPAEREAYRLDLLDLALLWTELRVRVADEAGRGAARREALAAIDDAEKRFGRPAVLLRERARHLRRLGETAAAESAESEAARQPPRTAWEHYAAGRAALQAERLEEAARLLDEAVRLRPSDFWPNFYQGVCAYRRSRGQDAVAAFRVCITLAPASAPCYYNRARALVTLGRRDEARQDLDGCLKLAPGLAPAWLARGLLSLDEGRFEAALADLDEALRRGADPATVHYDRALVHHARKDRAAALADLEECLRRRPQHALARELKARLAP
jgi:serine/threonine protein kinase/tetratricopeptide (TPR) repeat protein